MKTVTDTAPKKNLKKVLLTLAVLILVLLGTGVFLGLRLLNRLNRPALDLDPTPTATLQPEATPGTTPPPLEETPEPEPTLPLPLAELYDQTILTEEQLSTIKAHNEDTKNYSNILLLGVDRRSRSGNSRADTMMIATLDKKNKRIKLTSILRDTLVNIPGYGESRINRASAEEGGVNRLIETIDANLHIRIDGYVLVDFVMFERVVDKLGGVTIRMSAEEISAANDCIAGLNKQMGHELRDGFIYAVPGPVYLSGKQALGYARIRKIDSDFKRTNRQFNVLNAIYAKVKKQKITKLYDLAYDVMPLIETNLDNATILSLAADLLSVGANGILHYSLPAENTYKSSKFEGSSVLLSDLTLNAWLAHEFIYESAEEPKEAVVLKPGPTLAPPTPTPEHTDDPGTNTGVPDGGFGGGFGGGLRTEQ